MNMVNLKKSWNKISPAYQKEYKPHKDTDNKLENIMFDLGKGSENKLNL